MSENRKFLVAKRKEERSNQRVEISSAGRNTKQNEEIKKGIKRQASSFPKKNLANDRLKRLRTNLNQEVQRNALNQVSVKNKHNSKSSINFSRASSVRKRPSSVVTQEISVSKVPKSSICDAQSVDKSSKAFPFKPPSEGEFTFRFKEPTDQKDTFAGNDTQNPFTSANVDPPQLNKIEVMEWSPADEAATSTELSTVGPILQSENFYIVVDTNIFLSQLEIIKNIIEMDITGHKMPVIYIPWIVIEELDFIKDNPKKSSVKSKAQDAVKFIEQTLLNKNERMMGQTLQEVVEQQDVGKSQDNKIISCCFLVQNKYRNMVLLTNDVNLRNKAHINHIPVCSDKEIMEKIVISVKNQPKSEIILEKMTFLCRDVIKECAFKSYGEVCRRMPIYQNVPQTIQDCITTFTKYWFPVFQEVLLKQFKKSIDDLSLFLRNNSIIKDDAKELTDLARLCVRVCIFLKDIDSCKNAVENTIRQINDVKDF